MGANILRQSFGLKPGQCAPGEREVTVWMLQSDQVPPQALPLLLSVLDGPERAKAMAFRFDQHSRLYVVAHALLRAMLSAFTGRNPSAWRFVVNSYGRPELDPQVCELPLRFNLSHTEGLAACAIALRDVGVDVEARDRPNPDDLLVYGVFSAAERAQLLTKADRDRRDHFYRLWTLKEAFAKALGRGLSLPFDRIEFSLDPIRLHADDGLCGCTADWQFRLFEPTTRHFLALAAREKSGQDLEFTTAHVGFEHIAMLLVYGAGH
jgi:4'-phosphopantetheinyl transferase